MKINENVANQKFGNLRNLGILGYFIPCFLIPEFPILAYSTNRKLGFKKLGKKFPTFQRFPSFLSFRTVTVKLKFFLPKHIFY